jgi:hypothetical protein
VYTALAAMAAMAAMAATRVNPIRKWISMIRLLYYSQATPGMRDQGQRHALHPLR